MFSALIAKDKIWLSLEVFKMSLQELWECDPEYSIYKTGDLKKKIKPNTACFGKQISK